MLLFAALFAALGIYVIYKSFAASPKLGDCKQSPAWVGMLDDPDNTNYFKLQKCFEDYWSTHQTPITETDFEQPITDKAARKQEDSSKIALTPEELQTMPGAIMRYNVFLKTNFVFAQTDGRILSKKEKQDIWKSQQRTENRDKAKLGNNQ